MSKRAESAPHAGGQPLAPYRALASPPEVEVELLRDVARVGSGFLRVREAELQNRYGDGTHSEPYRYFMVERERLDAVALVLYRREPHGVSLLLRAQLRPPLAFRADYEVPLAAHGSGAVQWEIPAGLMEPGERGEAGLFARASAEALEETGFVLAPARFRLFGPPSSMSPGMIAEKLHFVCAELRHDDEQRAAAGDGHAVEERSACVLVSLDDALRALDEQLVHDIKTEVGIRRLHAFAQQEPLRERASPELPRQGA